MRQLKTPQGNYFEDFDIGHVFNHGVPRTITEADASLYLALTGNRFALHCAEPVAIQCGFKQTPLDNFLVFHIAFGKTVNDISLNAVANLGYAEVNFKKACFAGDSLFVSSQVIGLKENSNGKNGVVYVRSTALNQHDEVVVSWIRWVMVEKQTSCEPNSNAVIPEFQQLQTSHNMILPKGAHFESWLDSYSDNQLRFDELTIGDSIFHRDGITINDSDHSLATRLYQNNARVHFDQHLMNRSRHGKRLVYGGHIISLCRAISYNGLGNALWLLAINSGSHTNPCFAGDTVYCQSEILDKQEISGRQDVALVRIRTLGIKNDTPRDMPFLYKTENNRIVYHENLVLDLDGWMLMLK